MFLFLDCCLHWYIHHQLQPGQLVRSRRIRSREIFCRRQKSREAKFLFPVWSGTKKMSWIQGCPGNHCYDNTGTASEVWTIFTRGRKDSISQKGRHAMFYSIFGTKYHFIATAKHILNDLYRPLCGLHNIFTYFHEFHETCHSVTFYIMIKRLQTMLWHQQRQSHSHQRRKQTWFCVCFHLWCELTSTMNVTEWQVSWNSWESCP